MEYMRATEKAKLSRRLRIIEGQVRGLASMVEKGDYCIDIITQASAVKQGVSSIEDILMQNHLSTCVRRQMTSGQAGKAVNEVLKVYTLKRK